jgi:plasmid replication initiation protein
MKEKSRGFSVAKSNTLARLASVDTVYKQRAALYILSKLTPEDSDAYSANPDARFDMVFSLNDLLEVCKMPRGGNQHDMLKKALLGLTKSELQDYINEDGDLCTHTVAYLGYTNVNWKRGLVLIEIHRAILPHLLGLRERFISYELEKIIAMRSLFSSQLYERLLSYRRNAGTPQQPDYWFSVPTHSIGKMKEFFGVADKYDKNAMFYRYVLDKAVEEINAMTDLDVVCTREGRGDSVVISFGVGYKADRPVPVDMMGDFNANAEELRGDE